VKPVRSRLFFFGAAVTALIAGVACDLNPQPLPPGEQPDGGLSDTTSGNGGTPGGATEGDGAAATAPGDAGVPAIDGGTESLAADGSTDGALDAGDAGDAAEIGDAADAGD
jgi:hypothetical protein